MKALLLPGILLAATADPASATATAAQCDSKPFTLTKPAPPQQKPPVEQAKKATPAKVATAQPKPKPKPKPKPIAECDKPAAKPRG